MDHSLGAESKAELADHRPADPADPADCPLLNTASCDVERMAGFAARKSLKLLAKDGTALGHDRGVDRPLPPEVERQQRLRRVLKIVVPIVLVAVVLAALPGWIRPTVSRGAHPHGAGHRGPVEAVITAAGTVVPEVERVLSSPLDARVLRSCSGRAPT